MRIGEIVGGVALVGVAVLIGIALTDDRSPEAVTSDTSPFVFADATSTTPAATAAAPTSPAGAATSSPGATATTAAAVTTPATTAPPAPALIPPEQRAGIAVRVLNGGAPTRAATRMTATLGAAGFAPAGPGNAVQFVPATTVVYAPGRELDAATVNSVVGARPERVVPAAADDLNWTRFGGGLAVLVVLGPAGT